VSIQTGIGPGGVNVYFITTTPAGVAPPVQEMRPTSDAPPCITFTPPLQETQLPPAVDAPKPSVMHPSDEVQRSHVDHSVVPAAHRFGERFTWLSSQ
jgi:hypothetical protein